MKYERVIKLEPAEFDALEELLRRSGYRSGSSHSLDRVVRKLEDTR